ncbi:MAG TPA: Calx-beta domain-containing protein, partial [Planctomycetia bacterium]|nr:Calx-beta domain-containing protein [Planctomycetia bacterium]
LLMTVRLSYTSSQVVTVDYRSIDGTALVSNKDYVKTSGTLTFQPGETVKTIAVTINGDRRREPNETFTMLLSNAVGATINDGVGLATILNDD